MHRFTVKSLIVAGLAAFSLAGFGAESANAQEHQIELCPDGQTYEIHFVCDRVTLACVVEWEGCV